MNATMRVETREWFTGSDGYMHVTRTKSRREVLSELREIVGEYPEGGEEYFGVSGMTSGEDEWPTGEIVVFAVTGSSEGHYVHVQVAVDGWRGQELVLLAKTFAGADAAWAFARRLYDMLDAG